MSLFENKLTLIHSFLHFEMVITRQRSRAQATKRMGQLGKAAASAAAAAGTAAASFAVKNLLNYLSSPSYLTPKTPNPGQKQRPKITDVFNITPSPGMKGERKNQPYKRRSYKSASSSRSKGFFKKGTKKRTFLDRSNYAVTFCREEARAPALNVNVQTTYVGHATVTPKSLFTEIAYAMVKWYAIKLQMDFKQFTAFVKPFGTDNVVIELIGKANMDATPTVVSTFTCTAGVTTFAQLADAWILAITTWIAANPYGSLTQIRSYGSAAGRADFRQFDLSRARFTHGCKSTMKIQNRTINSAGNDEVDDVDNVPLYGKSYEGNGNYFKYRVNQDTDGNDFWISVATNIDQNVGIIEVPSTVTTGRTGHPLAEPPKPSQLMNVNRSGKAHLDPGEIKTSVLYHRITMNLNTFLRKAFIFSEGTLFTIRKDIKLGNYRIFAFEKMLKVAPETETTQMKLAYEVDQKSWCTFTAPKTAVVNTVLELKNA